MSKVLEKIMNSRLVTFLETKKLLSSAQFGFRRGVSTADAVHELTNCIFRTLDRKEKSLAIFLDLAKAFDTVSIPLLIRKLETVGVRGMQLKLFSDFLNDRTQQVKIGDILSDDLTVKYGVPQGSILGPTLFLIYINDLCGLKIPCGRIITFADDTALIFSSKGWEEVFSRAQCGFNIVNKWLRDNMLTLNATKTKYIVFTKKSSPSLSPFSIVIHNCNAELDSKSLCNCPILEKVKSIKYLGIHVDDRLSFHIHISMLASRLRKLVYVFKNLRGIADNSITKTVYIALCQSLLCYCITTWGGTYKSMLLKLERAQRLILKCSQSLSFRTPTSELYKLCEVLTVRQLYIMCTVTKQHCSVPYDPSIERGKRRPNVMRHSELHSNFSHKSFSFLGCFLYNKLNKILNLFSMDTRSCKQSVSIWLQTLNYEETEKLLIPDS